MLDVGIALGHGAASFWFRLTAPAIRQGFVPDSLGADLHTGNLNGPVIDMQTTMNTALVVGRVLAEGDGDLPMASGLAQQIPLAPLSQG